MKTIIVISILFFLTFSSCNKKSPDEASKKDLELKQRELDLKERELALREKELENKNSSQATGENTASGTRGEFPEVSLISLRTEDLENKSEWELRIMRNEVFARHGYIFKLSELREYFMSQNWYVPQSDDVNILLTPLEKDNIEKIKRQETYIGSQYNKFSR